MTPQEIREIAIESSKTYYKYLEENDRGIQELDLFELEYLPGSEMIIKLRLSGKLTDLDGVLFKNLRNDKKYDTSAVKILEYDYDKNVMLIQPGENAQIAFEKLKPYDLKVIVDLKFLVLRVKWWFDANGGKIKLPKNSSCLSKSCPEISYFEESEFQPSENQKQAIKSLFTNPFAYIWGAPGTGKTQFVLSYAILHYINHNKKVAILAPTNNAIEQVLKGVLTMTDKAGVLRKKLIRLGTPSKIFADNFPEVCEDRGINKKIKDLENQIGILKRVLNYSDLSAWISTGKTLIPLLEDLVNLSNLPRKEMEVRRQIYDQADCMVEKIKRDFSDYPEWIYFVNSLSIFNCKLVQKEMVKFVYEQELKQKTNESLYREYQKIGMDHVEEQLQSLITKKLELESFSTEKRLQEVNVVACTLDHYIGTYTDHQLIVDHFFLDEAGYANIIKTLTLFLRDTPVTFFGDHKQLPPVCEVNDFEMDKEEKYQNLFLWAQSAIFLETLFENSKLYCIEQFLKNGTLNPSKMIQCSLNTTYRFGENLANILAKHVYTPEFHSQNPTGETQIRFVNAEKMEPMKSRCSMNEVFEIKKVVQQLKKEGNTDFVILTPYKNQVKMLNKHLPQERNDFKILTVHGSQGREWNTVILSVVDTSDKWFVDSQKTISKGLNLINTAVSRAKKNLVIVCDLHYWSGQNGQLITDLYKMKSRD